MGLKSVFTGVSAFVVSSTKSLLFDMSVLMVLPFLICTDSPMEPVIPETNIVQWF